MLGKKMCQISGLLEETCHFTTVWSTFRQGSTHRTPKRGLARQRRLEKTLWRDDTWAKSCMMNKNKLLKAGRAFCAEGTAWQKQRGGKSAALGLCAKRWYSERQEARAEDGGQARKDLVGRSCWGPGRCSAGDGHHGRDSSRRDFSSIICARGYTEGAWMSGSEIQGGVKAGETPGDYLSTGGLLPHKYIF